MADVRRCICETSIQVSIETAVLRVSECWGEVLYVARFAQCGFGCNMS